MKKGIWIAIGIIVLIIIIVMVVKKQKEKTVATQVSERLLSASVQKQKFCIGGVAHIWGILPDGSGQYGWIPAFGRPQCAGKDYSPI